MRPTHARAVPRFGSGAYVFVSRSISFREQAIAQQWFSEDFSSNEWVDVWFRIRRPTPHTPMHVPIDSLSDDVQQVINARVYPSYVIVVCHSFLESCVSIAH